jgi:hypothetical protein
MKGRFACAMNPRLFAALILLVGAAPLVRAEIVFAGYLALDGEIKVILADTEAGRKSAPLGVGGTFAGRTVTGFNAEKETVAVTHDEEARVLPLQQAQTKPFTEADRAAIAQRAAKLAELKAQSAAYSAASRAKSPTPGAALRAQHKADTAAQRQHAQVDAAKYPGRVDMQQAVAAYRKALTEQLRRAKFDLEQTSDGARRVQAQARIADAERKLAELEREK